MTVVTVSLAPADDKAVCIVDYAAEVARARGESPDAGGGSGAADAEANGAGDGDGDDDADMEDAGKPGLPPGFAPPGNFDQKAFSSRHGDVIQRLEAMMTFAQLGADVVDGYGDDDSFIDDEDAEAVNEPVPAETQQKFGRFFVYKGALQDKNAADDDEFAATAAGGRRKELPAKRKRKRKLMPGEDPPAPEGAAGAAAAAKQGDAAAKEKKPRKVRTKKPPKESADPKDGGKDDAQLETPEAAALLAALKAARVTWDINVIRMTKDENAIVARIFDIVHNGAPGVLPSAGSFTRAFDFLPKKASRNLHTRYRGHVQKCELKRLEKEIGETVAALQTPQWTDQLQTMLETTLMAWYRINTYRWKGAANETVDDRRDKQEKAIRQYYSRTISPLVTLDGRELLETEPFVACAKATLPSIGEADGGAKGRPSAAAAGGAALAAAPVSAVEPDAGATLDTAAPPDSQPPSAVDPESQLLEIADTAPNTQESAA